jgi:hypothetical protein
MSMALAIHPAVTPHSESALKIPIAQMGKGITSVR